MSFNDELERTLDLLTDRLRDDVSRQVRAAVADIARAAQDERLAAERAADERLAAVQTAAAEAAERTAVDRAAAERAADERVRVADERAAEARVAAEGAAIASAHEVHGAQADIDAALTHVVHSVRSITAAVSLSEILDTLISEVGREASRVAVVLVRGERFQAWRLVGFDAEPADRARIEIASDEAGVIGQAAATAMPACNSDAPAFARLAPGETCVAVPLVLAGQLVAVLYADNSASQSGTLNAQPGTLNLERLEILALHTSKCLEALTAIQAARTLTTPPQPPQSDTDDYVSARRFARILVSEIRLYHEDQVAAGRRERDLASRLGGEIARVRALYDERVPQQVRQNTDYVREELIRTLADGDATLLEAQV